MGDKKILILKSFATESDAYSWVNTHDFGEFTGKLFLVKTNSLKSIGFNGGIKSGNYHVILKNMPAALPSVEPTRVAGEDRRTLWEINPPKPPKTPDAPPTPTPSAPPTPTPSAPPTPTPSAPPTPTPSAPPTPTPSAPAAPVPAPAAPDTAPAPAAPAPAPAAPAPAPKDSGTVPAGRYNENRDPRPAEIKFTPEYMPSHFDKRIDGGIGLFSISKSILIEEITKEVIKSLKNLK